MYIKQHDNNLVINFDRVGFFDRETLDGEFYLRFFIDGQVMMVQYDTELSRDEDYDRLCNEFNAIEIGDLSDNT